MNPTIRKMLGGMAAFCTGLVLCGNAVATQLTEFQRFREYVLNPEFVDITSTEAALMEAATGQITGQAKGYIAGASSPGSFVWYVTAGGVPTRMTSLGPVFTERGRTTGYYVVEDPETGKVHKRGRFSLGLYYSYADFKEFDGHDINDLFKGPQVTTTTLSTELDPGELFSDPNFKNVDWPAFVEATTPGPKQDYRKATNLLRQAGISFVTENMDLVEVTTDPFTYYFEETHEHLKQVAKATFQIRTHTVTALANFAATQWLDLTVLIPVHSIDWDSDVFREFYIDGVLEESSHARFGDSATGLGDITLRGKALLTRTNALIDCAAALDFRLPTGDEDEFLGTGSFGVTPVLTCSKELGRFSPYANIGYLFDTENSDWSRFQMKAGLDFTPVKRRLTVGGEFVGLIYDDFEIYDAGVSVKAAPIKDKPFTLAASVLFPVNEDGLRPDYVGVFGAEYAF